MDLKGHTVEELAAAANVTVDVIQAAIKLRQQQLLQEKRNYANLLKQKIANHVTIRPTYPTTSVRTTQPTTTEPSTTPFVSKRKPNKRPFGGGHKVRRIFTNIRNPFNDDFPANRS